MRLLKRALLAASLVLASTSCLNNPGGCPRAGLDSARRCKRLCVLNPARPEAPLACACLAECLCWKMSGHSARPVSAEDAVAVPR